MNQIAAWSCVCAIVLLAWTNVHAETVMPAEDYIKLTAFSERIVLITVKEVTLKTLKVDKGIESRKVSIKAKRIESLRGNDKDQDFEHTSNEERIVDEVIAKVSHPSDALDLFRKPAPHQPSSCKAGLRYLVIFLDDMTFFYEVPKDSDQWRSRIGKYQRR